MTDARIIIDELVIDCAAACSSPEARQLGDTIARAFSRQLPELQARRLQEIRRGDAAPTALHLERVVVRLGARAPSPSMIARTLGEALESARRRHD